MTPRAFGKPVEPHRIRLEERAKSLSDVLALRTLELTKVINESGAEIGGSLTVAGEIRPKIMQPLANRISELENSTDSAASRIAERPRPERRCAAGRTGDGRTQPDHAQREVGSELMARAETLSTTCRQDRELTHLFDSKGASLLRLARSQHEGPGRPGHPIAGELNSAVSSGSQESLGHIVVANDKLRTEVPACCPAWAMPTRPQAQSWARLRNPRRGGNPHGGADPRSQKPRWLHPIGFARGFRCPGRQGRGDRQRLR